MRIKITLKLTNDRGDELESSLERDFIEYEGGNKEEATKWGQYVAEELMNMAKIAE